MSGSYRQPTVLREWTLDIQGGELYQLLVLDDFTVCGVVGRYAHSSGSTSVSWPEFLAGALDDVVLTTMGARVLGDARTFVEDASA